MTTSLPDLGPDGFAGRAQLDLSTLAVSDSAEVRGPREQVARAAMPERLGLAVECYDAGDTSSQLNVIDSCVQYVREIYIRWMQEIRRFKPSTASRRFSAASARAGSPCSPGCWRALRDIRTRHPGSAACLLDAPRPGTKKPHRPKLFR